MQSKCRDNRRGAREDLPLAKWNQCRMHRHCSPT